MPEVDRIPSAQLADATLVELRGMFDAAFGKRFTDMSFQHSLGGTHFVVAEEGRMISHAAVVARTLKIGDRPVRTGFIEAVATEPRHQGRGLAWAVMAQVGEAVRETFEIGALATGNHAFYTRLGWEQWRGPLFVDAPTGRLRTAEDDGAVYILRTPSSATVDLSDPLTCDWRLGHVW
jgi:aminoglycoside 2'-N-acetyltransferase I